MNAFKVLAAGSFCLLYAGVSVGQEVPPAERVDRVITLEGILRDHDCHLNVSGISLSDDGKLLVVATDEGGTIQVLREGNDGVYRADRERNFALDRHLPEDAELDLEGTAWGKDSVFAAGSHSLKRKRVKHDEPDPSDNKSAKKNRQRLRTVEVEPARERIYRWQLDRHGRVIEETIEMVSLRNVFANDDLLRPFRALPSKENGIDIEGIAADGDEKLYLGLRGPVLRGNYVPIVVVEFKGGFTEDDIEESDVLFVNLGGRGIRDLLRLDDDEFLILAGPVGDGDGSFRLYGWNGKDCVPGTDKPDALLNARPLCEIPVPTSRAKAEGLALLDRSGGRYEFMIAYDGIPDGGVQVFRCRR